MLSSTSGVSWPVSRHREGRRDGLSSRRLPVSVASLGGIRTPSSQPLPQDPTSSPRSRAFAPHAPASYHAPRYHRAAGFPVRHPASRHGTGPLPSEAPQVTVAALFAVLTLFALIGRRMGVPRAVVAYMPYLWAFFLFFVLSEFVSFAVGIWVLAALSFLALREFFTLVDLRIEDRWGMVAAYLAIPFMFYFIQANWYGMFIISIPVYAFLVIPIAITLSGREVEGSVLSIGALDLGLFLLVYCIGHIGYLAFYSTWTAILVVAAVAICDLFAWLLKARDRDPMRSVAYQLFAPLPVIALLALAVRPWTGIPLVHSLILAVGIPGLVAIGCQTIDHLEADLGIDRRRLQPGRGEVINTMKSFVYVGPVVFHYLRYFLDAY